MDFCTERMDDAMHNTLRCMKRDWQLYLFLLVPVAYILIFAYYPMLGIQIAFKDYSDVYKRQIPRRSPFG